MSKKISELTTATDVTVNDFFQVVDLEDPTMASSGTNKKISARTLGNNLPVTATGSSASRSLKDRFADTVNVKDFGAVGDGVTDDTEAIQAAINAVGLSGSLYFPDGTYLVKSTLLCDDQFVNFIGSGISSTTIRFTPTTATVLFSFKNTVALNKAFSIEKMTITTNVASVGTAIKIEAKLTSAELQVNGQRDSLYIREVRIVQTGTGYWTRFLHSVNNGGMHLASTSFDNNIQAAQTDASVTGIIIEGNDARVAIIRAISSEDFYILRTNVAISIKSVSPRQVESIYLSTGEIVGCRTAAIKTEGKVGAIGLQNIHFDCNNYIYDGRLAQTLIGGFDSCDFRKGSNGAECIAGPMFAFDDGETINITGCRFSGDNHITPNDLNKAFVFSKNITDKGLTRTAISGCTFRHLHSVFGLSANSKVVVSGNSYNKIEGNVVEDSALENNISLRDGITSKTFVVNMNETGEQQVQVDVPVSYWDGAWPVALLQPASNTGGERLYSEYRYDLSTPSGCVFVIKGNILARPVRFSFLALGTNANPVRT